MADRYPLVYNPSANQLQELQSGDSLDAGGTLVKNAVGYSTAGGTSSQFLKADGSIDSNTYLTSAGTVALAQGLTGSPSINVSAVSGTTGTFSGAVSGTNGTFSGNVSAVNVSASSSVTAATFYGDGSQLTGIDASALKDGSDVKVQATATGATITGDISATNATFSGDLTVQGTTTTIDTAVTEVDSLEIDGSIGVGTSKDNNIPIKARVGSADSTLISLEADLGTNNNRTLNIRAPQSDSNTDPFVIQTGNAISFRVDSTDALVVKSYGHIGIGTDTVARGPLHIHQPSTSDCQIHLTNNNTGTSSSEGLTIFAGQSNGDCGFVSRESGGSIEFYTHNGSAVGQRLRINSAGHVEPSADNTYDLGGSSKRWRNIYTGDLNLSNEGSANDVDGTWGQYTIQEGEDDLFLINRRTGKKYKFNLTEVD